MTPTTPSIDRAIADARSLPDLLGKLQVAAPDLYTQLSGKSLASSRSPWGTLATTAVGYGAARWGLGWDEGTCALVAGAGLLAGAYAMRAITAGPIASWFGKPSAPSST